MNDDTTTFEADSLTVEDEVAAVLGLELTINFGADAVDRNVALQAFYAALAAAQGAFLPIVKNQVAKIKSRDEGGANYQYAYADMDAIREATKDGLSTSGLAMVFFPVQYRDGGSWLRGRLAHSAGGWMQADVYIPPIPDKKYMSETIKAFGGVVSYLRRYLKIAMLDLSSGDDSEDDGHGSGLDDGDYRGYTPTGRGQIMEHTEMKKARSIGELTRIMNGLSKADRVKYGAYFEVREQELQEGTS